MQQLPLAVRWRNSSTFESFVRGSNTFAVEYLQTLEPGSPVSLWLWGERACGRTHLLQASCARAGVLGRSAAYFPLRERGEFTPGALEGCEQFAVVCLDDMDQIAGQLEWERAIFKLYNGLHEHGGRLLLTGSSSPATLAWCLADLRSRLLGGLILPLHALADELRAEVLRLRARNRGLELPDETATFLLRHYPRDLGTLCMLLDTLDAASLAARRRLTIPFIKSAIDGAPERFSALDGKQSAC